MKETNIDEKILQYMKFLGFCGIPPSLLLILISITYGLINTHTSHHAYAIVLCQESIPVLFAYAVIPVIIFLLVEKKPLKDIGLRKNKYRWMDVIDFLLIILFMFFLIVKGVFRSNVTIWIFHYLCVAVAEEILVRGIILYEAEKIFYSSNISILISSIVFALVFHSVDGVSIANLLYRIPFGIIMAILYKSTGSLCTSVTIHWIYDAILSI